MEFKKIQEEMIATADKYQKKYNIAIDKEVALTKLFEEVGELAEAILTQKKKSRPEKFVSEEESLEHIGHELSDVVGMVVLLANLYNVDLEGAIQKKWMNR